MKVGIIGTGYVGLPTGIGFAELGHIVICADNDVNKVQALNQGKITLYEKDAEKLLIKNIKSKKIYFTSSIKECVINSDVIIIAVGTPIVDTNINMSDMNGVLDVIKEITPHLNKYKLIAVKSTVAVGTCHNIETLIKKISPEAKFDVVSLPEFLREGFALYDFFNPDRIVAGVGSIKAKTIINKLYGPLLKKTKILFVNRQSSELIKYASNSFLAVKISFVNELANFCEKTKADINEVSKGLGLDKRIGSKFLSPGPGYGGSCFPKDTKSLVAMANKYNVDMPLIKTVIKENESRKKQISHRILDLIKKINKPKIAILGLAFKAGTDDCRESPAIDIIFELLKHNVSINAYDPQAMQTCFKILGNKIKYSNTIYDAVEDADILVVLTEWEQFKNIDLKKISLIMKHKNILDCRNILDYKKVLKYKFNYEYIGGRK
ncbi:MAG: UDP-glucose/GDP-mannose dehydrogenase family protein [Endomicrobiaceae bacterium]|nr:UDP-glucose/GDP-mannose dehydrogenase family protein [Endomicrobiaceae bacterium]